MSVPSTLLQAGSLSSATTREALIRFLEDSKLVSRDAITRARDIAANTSGPIETVLTRLGLISEDNLARAYCEVLSLPLASDYPQEPVLEERISATFLKEAKLIPLEDSAQGLAVAFVNPLDSYAFDAVRFAARKPILPFVARPSEFEAAFDRLYGEGKSVIHEISESAPTEHHDSNVTEDIDRLKDSASEAPVIRLVNLIIAEAAASRASDIHIEPLDDSLSIRYRIDGVLQEVEAPPARLGAALVSRIKIMAKLNIAERRLPQDGRMKLAVRGKDIDFRVSTTPTIHGESVVLRILDRESVKLDFASLGFDQTLTDAFRKLIERPYGIVLVTGPTGSGKTTTLYAGLQELNSRERKILTIEDPVEYQIRGVNQVQVRPQIGYSFAQALRSFLRQDPDIMMVGEIRDLETAEVAIQAALTGHLILSTLHTNNAASAITRLLDMGVQDYLLTSTINGIAAQRLVRMLCPECRTPYRPLPALVHKLGLDALAGGRPITLHQARGCSHCNGTGYFGRTSILEVLSLSDTIRALVLNRASASELQAQALREGLRTMFGHGMIKALQGITSVEEVMRVAQWDE